MSTDDNAQITPDAEAPETPENAQDGDTQKNADGTKTAALTGGGNSPLTRATDYVARPGFRNPSNKRSKAVKKKQRRKKK